MQPHRQALLLAKVATQLNILLGLCVGHDSLFFKYSQAPVTVLAVKEQGPCAQSLRRAVFVRRLLQGTSSTAGAPAPGNRR